MQPPPPFEGGGRERLTCDLPHRLISPAAAITGTASDADALANSNVRVRTGRRRCSGPTGSKHADTFGALLSMQPAAIRIGPPRSSRILPTSPALAACAAGRVFLREQGRGAPLSS